MSDISYEYANELFKKAQAACKLLERCGFEEIGTGGGMTAWVRYFPNCEVTIHADNRSDLDPAAVDSMGITVCVGSDDDFIWTKEALSYEFLAPAVVEAVCKAMDQGETA